MSSRLFTLTLLVSLSLAGQAYGCRHGEGNDNKQREDFCQQRSGKGNDKAGCDHQRGGGYRRGQGGYSQWDIPAEDARQLNPIEVSQESLERGEALYRANCLRCHGDDGMGDGTDGNSLKVRPANLRRSAHHNNDGELSFMIRTGRDPMPAWQGKLSQNELWDLINYIRFDIGARHGRRGAGGDDNCPMKRDKSGNNQQ